MKNSRSISLLVLIVVVSIAWRLLSDDPGDSHKLDGDGRQAKRDSGAMPLDSENT
jgi:hypothetical protein